MKAFEAKNGLIDIYEDLIEDQCGFFTEEQKQELVRAKGGLINEQFSIVIAGRFSVGKSLFINRTFLKSDILPSQVNPTTCQPLYIEHGDSKQLQVYYPDGSLDIIDDADNVILETIKNLGTHSGGDKNRTCDRLVLRWNDTQILKNGIVLVDTIGTEDIDDQYIYKTEREMERASAVVFLFSAKQAGTQTELDFLERFMAHSSKRLFIVINKVDTLDTDADRQLVLDEFKSRLCPAFQKSDIRIDDRIFMVSAKLGTGLDELREYLVRFIEKQRVTELVRQHASLIQRKLESVERDTAWHLRELEEKKQGNTTSLREAKLKIEQYEEEWERRQEELRDMEMELVEPVIDNLKRDLSNLKRQGQPHLNKLKNSDDLKYELTSFIDRLTEISSATGKELEREIRKAFNRRLDRWGWDIVSRMDEVIADSMEAYDSSSTKEVLLRAGKVGGGVVSVGGGFTLASGTWSAISSYVTAVSAPVAKVGLLTQAWTALIGGATTTATAAPAVAAWAAGSTLIASGGAAVLLGAALFVWMGQNELNELRKKTGETMNALVKDVETRAIDDINAYTREQLEKCSVQIRNELEQKKARLQATIAENDPEKLQSDINEQTNRLKIIQATKERLLKLTA